MSEKQKLTGVVIDGVVYKVKKLDKKTCACDTCDIVDFCQKEQHVQSLCYFYLPKYAIFKKEQE